MSSSSGANIDRSFTRVLRDKGIDASIKCTSTLVANYNAEEDAKGREALRKWLEAYFDEFSQLRTGSIPKKAIAEFANLAAVNIREPVDGELVRRVYTTLSEVVMTKEGCSVYFVLALEHVLSTIDKEILQGDVNALIALADRLVEMTDPKKMPLTRDTFEHHASCLHAFERVLMVLHDLEKGRSNIHIVKYFEDKTKKHLDSIISCQCYYPFAYQALLIKEHLNALVHRDIKSNLINAGRRAFYAVCGGLYIFQGVRELAVMKLDFNVMVSGLEKIQQAFKNVGWDTMPGVQEIVLAASETVEHDDFRIFQQCYDKFKKVTWLEGLKWNKQRAIRYAVVSHLCLFCTEKHSTSIQASALDLLVQLATKEEGKKWRDDRNIFEAMINAIVAIGEENRDFKENVINTWNSMVRVQTVQQKKIIDECLNGMSFEEKIKCGCKLEDDDTSRSLFDSTRQRLGLLRTASIYNRNQETLKDYYKSDSFAKVSLFADESDQRHLKTFDFNLEKYEKVLVSRDGGGHSSQDDYNQRENNLQRAAMVRKPISMQGLFEKRGGSSRGLQEVPQRILMIGNPGTGKTCLTKRLCHEWATNAWGSQFSHVYLLPIRRIHSNIFGTIVDLPLIIQQLIYQSSEMQVSSKALYEEINDNLSKATTLLVLDGYDEAGEMAKDLVSSALTFGCSLLVSSRPHSVNDIRPRVDVEVECLEFSDANLENFVCKELGSENGYRLLEFLYGNLSIKDTCRVAVNAQIVARLWRKESYRAEMIETTSANLSRLYSMMTNYIWRRFTEERDDKFKRDSTYHSLECIAFESFKKNLVEIPEELVMDYAQKTEKVFRDSGFLLFVEEGSVFQFAHLTFHEYFTGQHLAKLLKSASAEDRKKAERFISEHKYIETSRVMLSFMTQCYCTRDEVEDNLEAFKDLMQVLESDPLPTISLQHLLLRMRTLDAFLPCGLNKVEVHTNDDVMKVVIDAMDALKMWFGFEFGDGTRNTVLCQNADLRTPLIDELARMPNLFDHFPHCLTPILLNETAKLKNNMVYSRDIARIGRLNPYSALHCIMPFLDNATDEEQANIIQMCVFIGPVCAEPTLNHLKRLCKDQNHKTRKMVIEPLVAFLDLFPEREDVQQLVLDVSRSPNFRTRLSLMEAIRSTIPTPKTEGRTFVWDLFFNALKDKHIQVRTWALMLCAQHYETFAKSIEEVMKTIREFAESPDPDDRKCLRMVISSLLHRAPEKTEEVLVLVKALCRDPNKDVQSKAVDVFLEVAKGACLRTEDIYNIAFDLFKVGNSKRRLELLPFLFSFDKMKYYGVDELSQLIANCQDLDKEVQEKAISCSAANALLSNHTIEEIYDKFFHQDKEVQMELVTQFEFDLREIERNKATSTTSKMAVQCLDYDDLFKPSRSLLEKLSKTSLLPIIVLEKLAKKNLGRYSQSIKPQPLSHLLEYYWTTKDQAMIPFIAKKLLLLSVTFEKKGETEMAITLTEKGSRVEQTAPFEVVQNFLSFCKVYLKEQYGLDFLED